MLTGGNSRAAQEIIKVLVSAGHNITVLDISPIRNTEDVSFIKCDLRNPKHFKEVVNRVIEGEFGPIESIINLARTPRSPGLIKRYSDVVLQEWRDTFDIQAFAPYFFTIEVAKSKKNKNQLRSVVNVSSVLSHHVSSAESASYHASKAAAESITRILAVGLGEYKVRVNSLSPGFIENKFVLRKNPILDKIQHTLDLLKILDSKLLSSDVGNVLNFLISTESQGISGQMIVVDQGIGIQETLDAAIRVST